MKNLVTIPANSTFSILLAILLLSACVTYPPHRPVGIDEQAVWAGGRDGGVWVNCQTVARAENIFRCSIFDELGALVRQEEFSLVETRLQDSNSTGSNLVRIGRAVQLDEVRQIGFRAYDGKKLSLLNGWALVPESLAD